MQLSESDWRYVDERAAGFIGRVWVFERIRSFLSGPEQMLVVCGPPGSGKTAVAAQLALASARRGAAGTPSALVAAETFDAAFFCRAGRVDLLDVAQRLAAQLADAVPNFLREQQKALATQLSISDVRVETGSVTGGDVAGVRITLDRLGPERSFSAGVTLPLARLAELQPTRPAILLVDGLDEAFATPVARELPQLLGQLAGAKVVATSRDDPRVTARLGESFAQLNLRDDAPADACDLLNYAQAKLEGEGPDAAMRTLAARVADEADGNFLYCTYVTDALVASGDLSGLQEEDASRVDLPTGGLTGFYRDFVRRELASDEAAWSDRFRPILAPLAVALGDGLTTAQLAMIGSRLAGHRISPTTARDVTRVAGQFLEGQRPHGPFRPYHQSFGEFLTDPEQNPHWLVDESETHQAIAAGILEDVPKDEDGRREWHAAGAYARTHLGIHAALAGVLDDLLLDPGYLLVAHPPTLLRGLSKGRSEQARRVGHAYQHAVHHLATAAENERAAYIAFGALKVGSADTVERLSDALSLGWWAPVWVRWRTRHPHRIVDRHGDPVVAVALVGGPEEPLLLSCARHELRVWDLKANAAACGPVHPPEGHFQAMTVASRSGFTTVIVGTDRGSLWALDVSAGPSLGEFGSRAQAGVTALAEGTLGGERVIVCGDEAGVLRFLHLSGGLDLIPPFAAYTGQVQSIVLGRIESREVVLTSGDPIGIPRSERRLMHVWDPVERELIAQSPPGEDAVFAKRLALWTTNDAVWAVGGYNTGAIRVWTLPAMELVASAMLDRSWVEALVVHKIDGEWLSFAASGAAIHVYRLPTLQEQGVPWQGHDEGVSALTVGRLLDRPLVVSGGHDGTVRAWDVRDALSANPAPTGHEGAVNGLALGYVADRDAVLSVGHDCSLRVWDLHTGVALREPLFGDSPLTAVAFVEVDGRQVGIAGSQMGVVQAWDLTTGGTVWRAADPDRINARVNAFGVHHASGETVVLYAGAHLIRRRRAFDGTAVEPSFDEGRDKTMLAIAIAKLNGQAVALWGGGTEQLNVWDLERAIPLAEPWRHPDYVTSVAAAQVGSELLVVTGCDDGKVRTRNLAAAQSSVQVLDAHSPQVKTVAVVATDEGRLIAAGGGSGVVRLWRGDGTPVGQVDLGSSISALLVAAPSLLVAATYGGIVALRLQEPLPRHE